MISVVIPYYEIRREKREMLRRAVGSFKGYDELIIVWNDGIGMSKAVNRGFELSKGDFIVMASDDAILTKGSLADLAVPGTVTSPMVNHHSQDFSGVLFCVPREIYERYGMWDEAYCNGIYFEDEDYWMKLKTAHVPHFCVEKVEILHPEGGATLNHTLDYDRKSAINKDYYYKKWGLYEILEDTCQPV